MDITRREDAFDLSGPFLPPQEPMPQRPVSTGNTLRKKAFLPPAPRPGTSLLGGGGAY